MAGSLSFSTQSSGANLADPVYSANRDNWTPILEQFEENLAAVSAEGNDASLARHQQRGQLLRMWSIPRPSYSKQLLTHDGEQRGIESLYFLMQTLHFSNSVLLQALEMQTRHLVPTSSQVSVLSCKSSSPRMRKLAIDASS